MPPKHLMQKLNILKSEEEIQTLITKFKEEPSESIAKQLMNHVEMLSSKIKEMIEPFLKS